MNTNFFIAKNINMKKSTKILIILFFIVSLPNIYLGKFIFDGIKFVDGNLSLAFDVRAIIGIVLIGVSAVLGSILFFRFLSVQPVDKVLFFSTMPLIILYGIIIYFLSGLKYYQSDLAKFMQKILNITTDNEYNIILWSVLVSIVFLILLFAIYLIVCRPIGKVERIVARLGDGMVKDKKFSIGGGKQFNSIEHSLNKINNSYQENENSKFIDFGDKKKFPKQLVKILGQNNVNDLLLGRNVRKDVFLMLFCFEQESFANLQEKYEVLKFYLNLITPEIKKYGGYVLSHSQDGIFAVFGDLKSSINCLSTLSKKIEMKSHRSRNFAYIKYRISLIFSPSTFAYDVDNSNLRLVSDEFEQLEKMISASRLIDTICVFDKSVVDQFPLSFKIGYRLVGSMGINGRNMSLFENLDLLPRNVEKMLLKTKPMFENGVLFYNNMQFDKALECFSQTLRYFADDRASYVYYNKAYEKLNNTN